jgi:hypothetical protein
VILVILILNAIIGVWQVCFEAWFKNQPLMKILGNLHPNRVNFTICQNYLCIFIIRKLDILLFWPCCSMKRWLWFLIGCSSVLQVYF